MLKQLAVAGILGLAALGTGPALADQSDDGLFRTLAAQGMIDYRHGGHYDGRYDYRHGDHNYRHGDRRYRDHYGRHGTPVYRVRFHEYRRFVDRHGHRFHGDRFEQWIRKHGQPVHQPRRSTWRSHWDERRFGHYRPDWIYINVRTNQIWF